MRDDKSNIERIADIGTKIVMVGLGIATAIKIASTVNNMNKPNKKAVVNSERKEGKLITMTRRQKEVM